MANLTVYNRKGESVGDYEIAWSDISATINKQLLHDAVVMYQANLRQGTHRTKTRGEVAGATTKMYRQKGTGRARAGSRRSGIRRGGGHIHAKRPRDYSYRMPRKAVQAATRMAIASKLRDEEVVIVEALEFEQPSTKQMAAVLQVLPLAGKTTLLVTESHNLNVYKSARNIPGVKVLRQTDLNAYGVLVPRRIVFTKDALDAVKQRAAGGASTADAETAGSVE
ncbi:50S ribosomal protein L4 [Lignipirellula cremea]|uniref:Large ribosomal subunit protein uL4 n=1 Tax=Lignipirellula cremea TaxID=2528010 RepID=A0A518DMZ3_9BACT|nr:50S ribosomal protein L4 [Lignipirellula cremea]QDU93208.1 50S ribosomal protein L4 [Lignipirellula cremea]